MRPWAENESARYEDSSQVLSPLVVTGTELSVDGDDWPNVKELGLAEIEKSGGGGTWVMERVTVVVWDMGPLVPVTLTL